MFSAWWNRDTGAGGVMGNEVEAISCSWNRHLTDSWKKLETQMGNFMADRPLAADGYGVPTRCLLLGIRVLNFRSA